jgi:DNA recombination-dependent growth factor C
VDDKIPAMLSNGEYVLPADTVKKIGKEKLDKVVKETHTPAEIQRKRKALKGKK